MDPAAITDHIRSKFPTVKVVIASSENGAPEAAWGDIFFIDDPDGNLPPQRQFPFATIVVKDYPGFDEASDLNRPGIFRLNIGVTREAFENALRSRLDQPRSIDAANEAYDLTSVDNLMPHPVYGKQHWLCILNPSEKTFRATIEPLIETAFFKSR